MGTSGQYNYLATRDTIIQGALRLAGALGQGETPTTAQVTEAAEALNMYAKFLSTKGVPIFAVKTRTVALVANQAAYNINVPATATDDKPLNIYACSVKNTSTNVETPMTRLSRNDYADSFSNKTSNGLPVNYYFDPGVTQATISVYPVPDATIAASYQLFMYYQRPAQDFDSSTDNPDFPVEWHEVIKYGLAVRLSGEYGLDRFARSQLKNDYKEMYDQAKGFDQEAGSIFFQADSEER